MRARASLVVLSRRLRGREVGERLACVGDREWDEGDPVRVGSQHRQRFSGWSIDSTSDRSSPPGAHLAELLHRAEGLAGPIAGLVAAGEIESSRVWLHIDTPDAGLAIEPETLLAIAQLGSFEIDLYS